MNFFVPNLNDENDSDRTKSEKWKYIVKRWEDIVHQQFQLSYYGHVNYSESQHMSVHERTFLFDLLIETKKKEAEARAKALAEAKQKSSRRKSK